MSIGKNIQQARKMAGLTQKELGARLGIKQQSIAMFENDKTNIKYSTVKKIAEALNVPINQIIKDNVNNYFFSGELGKQYLENFLESAPDDFTNNLKEPLNMSDFFWTLGEKMFHMYKDTTLLTDLFKFNPNGIKVAEKRIHEMTMLTEYTANPEDTL